MNIEEYSKQKEQLKYALKDFLQCLGEGKAEITDITITDHFIKDACTFEVRATNFWGRLSIEYIVDKDGNVIKQSDGEL